MSNEIIDSAKDRMLKSVEHTREEMMKIRTGKAASNMLDSVKVDYYGTPTPLKQIATIGAPEARLLVIQPFDKNSFNAIEKAIQASDLGFNPQNDGRVIRVPVPMLTVERREELVKVVRRFGEEGRVAIRNIRREFNDQIKKSEKDSVISEDQLHKQMDEIQKLTDKHIAEIDALLKTREEEIREQ